MALRVFVDTDVLVALCKISAIDLMHDWPGVEFCLSDVTMRELSKAPSRNCVQIAIDAGILRLVELTEPAMLEEFAQLAPRAGPGEAAMMILARHYQGIGISNDTRAGKVARSLPSSIRVVTMDDLYVRCIAAGRLPATKLAEHQTALRGMGEFVPLRNGLTSAANSLPPLPQMP